MKSLYLLLTLTLCTAATMTLEACQSAGRDADCPDLDACLEAIDGTAGNSGFGGESTGGSGTGGSGLGGLGGTGGAPL